MSDVNPELPPVNEKRIEELVTEYAFKISEHGSTMAYLRDLIDDARGLERDRLHAWLRREYPNLQPRPY